MLRDAPRFACIVRYSPDEIKAIVLHYGSYEKASKKLHIGKASLVDAGNADIKGKVYRLSDKNYEKISKHLKRLGSEAKKDIKGYEKILESTGDHPNQKRAFMNAKHKDREWVMRLRGQKKYRALKEKNFWGMVMSKFYDKYGWQRGQFKR